MGVRGLTSYIAENSDLYLRPLELSDSYLVVDGSSVCCQLYLTAKHNSFYGGDYDNYAAVIRKFFNCLKSCHVKPIIILDGGYEPKKIKTIKRRTSDVVLSMNGIDQNYQKKIFPLFRTTTFLEVAKEFNLICFQSDFEADREIATVANVLNCPVLGYDSDYYLYDVLYIPFTTLALSPVQKTTPNGTSKNFMKCSIYNVNNLLGQFDGLDKSMLPILAALMGNDYIKCSIFDTFCDNVRISKNTKKSYTQRKLHGVLNWLKKESFESAVNGILMHVKKIHKPHILTAIRQSQKDYSKGSVSAHTFQLLRRLMKNDPQQNCSFSIANSVSNWPRKLRTAFNEGEIAPFIKDILTLGIYFTKVQVEDLSRSSTHLASLDLIRAIKAILKELCLVKADFIKCYVIHKKKYTALKIYDNNVGTLKDLKLCELMNESNKFRLKLFFDILGFDEDDILVVSAYDDVWSLFMTACVYWIKALGDTLTFGHVSALLLMAIGNEVVQKRLGYCGTLTKFNSRFNKYFIKHTDTILVDKERKEENFREMLQCIYYYELLMVQRTLMPIRKENANLNASIHNIHLFNVFQSCLYHIMQINALLNYPLKNLKISDFYSGTLLFNLFIASTKTSCPRTYGDNLLRPTPNILKLYTHLCHHLEIYFDVSTVRKRRPKKIKKKAQGPKETFEVLPNSSDGEEYNDEANPYLPLRSCTTHQNIQS